MYYEVPRHSERTAYALRIEPVGVFSSPLEVFSSYHCPTALNNVKVLGLLSELKYLHSSLYAM
jgi:hypothetical protein